jgi:hypothetical protein
MKEKSEEKLPLEQQLETATKDLEMPSESDEPFRVFSLVLEGELDSEKLPELLELKQSQPIEKRELDDFFESAATSEDWMEDEEKATAQRFANLRDLLKAELKDVCVYLYGERERDVVVVGETESGFAGLVTLIVET